MIAYIFFLFYFMLLNYQRGLTQSDDLRCWGLAVKNYYYYSSLFSLKATDLSALHPPAIRLWNYFSTKLWITYSESICLFSQDMLTVSVLLPFFSFINGKGTMEKMDFCSCFCFSGSIIEMKRLIYLFLYTDALLGILTAYTLCMVYLWIKSDCRIKLYHINLLFGLAILCMTKRTGIFFSGIIVMVIFGLLSLKMMQKKLVKRKCAKYFTEVFLVVIVPLYFWNIRNSSILGYNISYIFFGVSFCQH